MPTAQTFNKLVLGESAGQNLQPVSFHICTIHQSVEIILHHRISRESQRVDKPLEQPIERQGVASAKRKCDILCSCIFAIYNVFLLRVLRC
jgi:hypothetical protein